LQPPDVLWGNGPLREKALTGKSPTFTDNTGTKMSYHGSPPLSYEKAGIAVVNPLHRIEKKLSKIEDILLAAGYDEDVSKGELLALLEGVLNE